MEERIFMSKYIFSIKVNDTYPLTFDSNISHYIIVSYFKMNLNTFLGLCLLTCGI